jgi:DNA-binding transcriptional MocR family regulator
MKPYNPRLIAIGQDEHGMCPDKLREALAKEGPPDVVRARNTGAPKVSI